MTAHPTASIGTNWHESSATIPATQLAKPWLFRRHGRYYLRLRPRNQRLGVYSVALRTSSRSVAVSVTKAITQALDHFRLNNPEATWPELRARLIVIAEDCLAVSHGDDGMDWAASESYRGMYLALRQIGKRGDLSADQYRAVGVGQKIMVAANARAEGNHGELVRLIDQLTNEPVADSCGPASLSPSVSPPKEPLSWSTLSELYMAEHSVNLKGSSRTTAISTHKVLKRAFEAVGVTDLRSHTREDLTALRGWLLEDRKASTVNTLLGQLIAVLGWAEITDKLPKHYAVKLKLTRGTDSERVAFTREQVVTIMAYANALPATSWERWALSLGIITGARIGELCGLTEADIRQVDGLWCIDINEDDEGKSIKNKHSKRLVPLVDGALDFDLGTFLQAPDNGALPSQNGVNSGKASKVLGKLIKQVLGEDQGEHQTLHSLRHHMAASMKTAGVELQYAQAVTGHASRTVTYDTYGGGIPVQKKHEAIRKALGEVTA